jgi:hypothetical protein
MKQILQNFSWETVINLPPSEFLALLVIPVLLVAFLLALWWFFTA